MLDARRNDVESQYANAEAQKLAADELKAQYEKSIAGIEEEMRAKITEAVKDGSIYLLDRQRLQTWQRKLYAEIESAADLLLPQKS